MNVLVVGGSGFIGRNLCRELIDRGHSVTTLSRTPDSTDLPDGVETAIGDVTAYDSLEEAFEGRDAVYNLVSPSPLFEPSGGNEMYDRIHRQGTEHCVRAAETHDVGRFVQLSALGADPDGATHYIRAKGEAERVVRESDLDWTIIRPSVVFGDDAEFLSFTRKLTPPFLAPLPGGGKTRFQPIYVAEFVSMLADSIEDGDHVGQIYEIGGPEILRLSEVAKLVRKARGQSVRIVPIPMSLARIGLSIGDVLPFVPMGRDQYRSLQFDNTTTTNDVEAFGLGANELTNLSTYLGVDV